MDVTVRISAAMQSGIEQALAESPESYPDGATVATVVQDACVSSLASYVDRAQKSDEADLLRGYRRMADVDKDDVRALIAARRAVEG